MTSNLLDDINRSSSTMGGFCNGKWKDNVFYANTEKEKIDCELATIRYRTLICYKICEKEYPNDIDKCLKQCNLIYCIGVDSSVLTDVSNSVCNTNSSNYCDDDGCSVEKLNEYCNNNCKDDKDCIRNCKSITPLIEEMNRIQGTNTIEKYEPPNCSKKDNYYDIIIVSVIALLLLIVLCCIILFKN